MRLQHSTGSQYVGEEGESQQAEIVKVFITVFENTGFSMRATGNSFVQAILVAVSRNPKSVFLGEKKGNRT